VGRLDRLARSTRDLLNVLDVVAKAGACFRTLADARADTTTPHGRLMLVVLGALLSLSANQSGPELAREEGAG
jgi:DNA invertase Pin-like site-specific DNA recombinase